MSDIVRDPTIRRDPSVDGMSGGLDAPCTTVGVNDGRGVNDGHDVGDGSSGGGSAWSCPVCGVDVPHPVRPGRARVYCTDACKQRAYRWRCRHRPSAGTPLPAARVVGSEKLHSLRSDDDLVTDLAERRCGRPHRRVTACGTFGIAARDRPSSWAHTDFLPTFRPTSDHSEPERLSGSYCASCVTLLRAPLTSPQAAFERARELHARRRARTRAA